MSNTSTSNVYRIFMSSTAIDLKEHRKAVSDAILRLEDQPVTMETFGALPNEPVEGCLNKVHKSDAVVVIVAHRYGWIPGVDEGGDGKKSITWLEVETALNEKKPVFAFLVDMSYGWTLPKEQDLLLKAKGGDEKAKVIEKVDSLQEFRTFLENKTVREIFTTPDNLALKVVTSLSNWARETITAPVQRSFVFRVVHPLQPAPHFRGRKNTLKGLQEWWEDPVNPDRVLSLIAIGGTGKTAVIEHFLKTIIKGKLQGSVLVWSFYEEPNTDAFLSEACKVFASEKSEVRVGGRLERLQRALIGNEPHLLVLDGLERIQYEGKSDRTRGDLEDHRLKNLLRSIASGDLGPTRALITSRFKLTDLQQWEGAGYRCCHLNILNKQTAVAVLKAWKVQGKKEELLDLAESMGRHAISVSALGSYLRDFCNGNPEGAQEFKLEEVAEDNPQAAKLGRILGGYAKNLPDDERELLIRLSVFPKGVSVDVLVYIVDAGGKIAGALIGCKQAKLNKLAQKLHKRGLVYTYNLRNTVTYTAHPFLREYFRKLLGVPPEKIHEVIRSKLATRLDTKPAVKPRDTETLDRYEALIEHSILAGRFQGAYDLFIDAMGGGGGQIHLFHTLEDYGRIIRIMSMFSDDNLPDHLTLQLNTRDRSNLINLWGMGASELGDLHTAERCFDIANELDRKDKDWGNFSQGLQNSAWITMNRGAFPSAQKLLTESLEYAEDDDNYIRRISHSFLANTYHALGEISEARNHFSKSREIVNQQPQAENTFEAEHLFTLGHQGGAYKHTEDILTISKDNEWQKEIAHCHILLGRILLLDSLPEARKHLRKVRDWTDQSGNMRIIIHSHILAAEIAYCSSDFAASISEATKGLNLAVGCGFGRFAIDLLNILAKINLAIPDARTALRNARKALDHSQHSDCLYAWGEADALHLCGIAHTMLKEPQLAKKRFKAAVEIRQRIQHPGTNETIDYLNQLK